MPNDDAKEVNSTQNAEPGKAAETDSEKKDEFKKIDADEIVKPYIDRITKEQAQKNDYKNKYEDALKELDQLKQKGSKSAKKITEDDERAKEIEDLKKQNADLSAQIAHSKTIKDVNSIFKKAELNVDDDVLNMVANNDAEVTASNAKAIINLVNKAREEGRNSILKGKTPKVGGNKIKSPDADLKRALGLKEG